MLTIAQALKLAEAKLGKDNRLDAELLLCHLLNKSRSFLLAFGEQTLAANESEWFEQQLLKLGQGMPVAYILGEREFWSLPFTVTEDTLIPRPDTETLVEFILQRFATKNTLTVLDAGTGSGAIAISLKKERPSWQVMALDYSLKALRVAKQNAGKLQADIALAQADWLAAIKKQSLDVVVANPPYIDAKDPHLPALKFEPVSALVANKQGFADIEVLINQSLRVLKPKGELWFEHGFEQSEQSQLLLQQAGFSQVQSVKDLSGHWRLTGGVLDE